MQCWETKKAEALGYGFNRRVMLDASIVERMTFKQAVTVAKWLGEQGLKVTSDENAWQHFVEFAISEFVRQEQSPILAQIKNIVLLKRFRAGVNQAVDQPEPFYTPEELEQLYTRIVVPEIAANVGLMMLLGLRRTKRNV